MVHIILEWIETIQIHIQCPRYKNQMIYYYTFSSTKESFSSLLPEENSIWFWPDHKTAP